MGGKREKRKKRKRTPSPPSLPSDLLLFHCLLMMRVPIFMQVSQRREARGGFMPHGRREGNYASSKRVEKKTLLSSPMIELMGPPTRFCHAYNNMMHPLETRTSQNPKSYAMSPCTS